jgi:transcriptional regulator with XRE-family HTH domain
MAQRKDKKFIHKMALVLKDLRDEKEVSQEDVYLSTNVHIGRIESGTSNPTIATLSILLKYFGIKFSDFFYRVETKSER